MEALEGPGFLGTQANLMADLTFAAEILFYLLICLAVVAQLNRAYHWHDRLQIPVVVLNTLVIAFLMIPPFFGSVAKAIPANFSRPPVWVGLVHGLLGLAAQGLAIYCLLAGTKILPRRIGRLRYWMWATFVAWTATVLFGVVVYLLWFTGEGIH